MSIVLVLRNFNISISNCSFKLMLIHNIYCNNIQYGLILVNRQFESQIANND